MTTRTLRPYLTVEDLAALLRTTPGAIHQRRHRGDSLPPAIRVGRRWLFDPDDVAAWLATFRNDNSDAGPSADAAAATSSLPPSQTGNRQRG